MAQAGENDSLHAIYQMTETSLSKTEFTSTYHQDHIGYSLNGRPFFPKIFDGLPSACSAKDFNTVIIVLKAGVKEDLNWKMAREQAQEAVTQGLFILWEMDLGFASGECLPLSEPSQYLSFQIALDYFKDGLWKEFSDHTFGLSLYKGSIDFTAYFKWIEHDLTRFYEWLDDSIDLEKLNQELHENLKTVREASPELLQKTPQGLQLLRLHCCALFIDYLTLLSSALPAELQLFLFLDCSSISDRWMKIQLTSPDRFMRFNLIFKDAYPEIGCLSWGSCESEVGFVCHHIGRHGRQTVKIGMLLPSSGEYLSRPFIAIEKGMEELRKRGISFRMISESCLTDQWDGLDFLVIEPLSLTAAGKRMIHGFCAAGGMIVSLDASSQSQFSEEVFFENWLESI